MIRNDFKWFTDRAEVAWRIEPGRSLLIIIPNGCDDILIGEQIEKYIQHSFILPPRNEDSIQKVFKITTDINKSTEHFVDSIIMHSEKLLGKTSSAHHKDEACEKIEIAIDELNIQNIHPVFLIKRFHSFASIHDDSLAGVLATLREMEHVKKLTSIILSPINYDLLRKKMAENPEGASPFLNSAYGDNHDKIVIAPVEKDDFILFAKRCGISDVDAQSLYSIGGGPDIVYEKLVQNKMLGVENLVRACVTDCGPFFQKFFKDCGLNNKKDLLNRLAKSKLNTTDAAFLAAIDLRRFLISSEDQLGFRITSKIIEEHILTKTLLEEPEVVFSVFDLAAKTLIEIDEGQEIEFKPGAFGINKLNEDGTQESKYKHNYIVLEELASFLNTNDGVLLLGILDRKNTDSGEHEIIGIDGELDAHKKMTSHDDYLLSITQMTIDGFGHTTANLISSEIEIADGKALCRIHVKKSPEPVVIRKVRNWSQFFKAPANYVRNGSRSNMLDAEEWRKHCNQFF